MTRSARVYRRKRPALGTFVTVAVADSPRAAGAVGAAFAEVARLEAMLSAFARGSALARLNDAPTGAEVEVPAELASLLRLALRVRRVSGGAFDLFFRTPVPAGAIPLALRRDGDRTFARKTRPVRADLSGIAKGFIVDRAVAVLTRSLPGASGSVDAGGDLRFFGRSPRAAAVRVGPVGRPVLRRVRMGAPALACSSPAYARATPRSSTRYARRERSAAAAAVARTCAAADALTKVGLFAAPSVVRACARDFGADILRFDAAGRRRP